MRTTTPAPPLPEPEIAAEARRRIKLYLRSLTSAEEVAYCLAQRCWTLDAVGRLAEAWEAITAACRFAPHHDGYAMWAKGLHKKMLDAVLKPYAMTGESYARLLESRLHGSEFRFPWEPPDHPPRIPTQPVHPIHDPLGAVAFALAAKWPHHARPAQPSQPPVPIPHTHPSGRPSSSPHPTNDLPGLNATPGHPSHINGRRST